MPRFSRFTNFYQWDYLRTDYLKYIDLLFSDDFIFFDNAEIFYQTEDNHIELFEFLNALNDRGVNFLLLEHFNPILIKLYKDYQICSFLEKNVKDSEMLLIFNCSPVEAHKCFNIVLDPFPPFNR
jgi:site-specific DNA-adenine methylase